MAPSAPPTLAPIVTLEEGAEPLCNMEDTSGAVELCVKLGLGSEVVNPAVSKMIVGKAVRDVKKTAVSVSIVSS